MRKAGPPPTPVIRELQAAGVTSLADIAAAFNERGIPTASGRGTWQDIKSSVEERDMAVLGRVDKPNPDSNGCQDDEGREAFDEFVVAGGDPS